MFCEKEKREMQLGGGVANTAWRQGCAVLIQHSWTQVSRKEEASEGLENLLPANGILSSEEPQFTR